ncbi:MAG: hypothetical protein U9P71_09035 [Campylobacterota bacterium]|nr:hypothetical protein [Campylobacterota bacterium]
MHTGHKLFLSSKVIINRGERDGVKVGTTFNVGEVEELVDPDTGKKLQKLLVRRGGSYATYTLTHSEAREVMKDVRLYNRTRLKMMENANTVVITK